MKSPEILGNCGKRWQCWREFQHKRSSVPGASDDTYTGSLTAVASNLPTPERLTAWETVVSGKMPGVLREQGAMTISAYVQTTPAVLCETAERLLQSSPYFFLRRVRCTSVGKNLFLRGTVPNQRLADIAEAIVSRIDGVEGVINCLEIAPTSSASHVRTVRIAG